MEKQTNWFASPMYRPRGPPTCSRLLDTKYTSPGAPLENWWEERPRPAHVHTPGPNKTMHQGVLLQQSFLECRFNKTTHRPKQKRRVQMTQSSRVQGSTRPTARTFPRCGKRTRGSGQHGPMRPVPHSSLRTASHPLRPILIRTFLLPPCAHHGLPRAATSWDTRRGTCPSSTRFRFLVITCRKQARPSRGDTHTHTHAHAHTHERTLSHTHISDGVDR